VSKKESQDALDRRELLGSVGVVAAAGLLAAEAAGAANPAAAVADKGSAVRIRGLKTHLVGSKVFIQLETNHKVSGWGEISALEPHTAEALVKSLFEIL
jgi:hypothetical protein